MVLPHSGYRDEPAQLLFVRTNFFDLTIQGKPFHPTVEALQLHRDSIHQRVEARLEVVPRGAVQVEEVLVFSSEKNDLAPLSETVVTPCFYETQNYQLVIQPHRDQHVSFYHENVHIRKAVKPLPRSSILTGTINFQNEVGYTDLEVWVNGQTGLVIRLEIFPVKLDYKQDYFTILEDVNCIIRNLSFDFLKRTYQLTGLNETRHQSLTEFFSILQQVFQKLVQAVEWIQSAPHSVLTKDCHVMQAGKVKKAGSENIPFLSRNPHLLVRDDEFGMINIKGQIYRPEKLIESKRKIVYNTTENRFLRWMLERIDVKLNQVGTKLKQENASDPFLLKKIANMQGQLRRLQQLDFLQQAGPMRQMSISLVLQMAPGYREAYRIYLMLIKGLAIQSDLFHLSMKDLAQLYEYWCFLKIHELLSRKYKLLKQDIIRVDRNWLFVTLDRSRAASVTYENPRNGERFSLYYNSLPKKEQLARFPTLSQRPDTVLHLRKQDAGSDHQEYMFVFDAKYRLNPAYEGTSYHRSYGAPGPEENDINTMHRYRDAIVYQEKGGQDYERSMFGAYVLFPYADEEHFKEHQFYKSIKLVNVGAFPFLPQATRLLEQFLDELILDSPEKAYERSTRPKGTSSYYRNKFMGKNVLVGSMRPGQLEVALVKGFYHMPIKNLRDHKVITQLEYIALCQSRRQFGGEAGIRWYGRIDDWKVVKRKDILEIEANPKRAEELYVYFTIGKWEKREPPIQLGGRWIETCLFTTKYVFDRALEIAELTLETEEQIKEWREKRRRGRVRIDLDHEMVDLARKVTGIRVEE